MCGIAAIVSHQPVNQELYDALTVLQHRGQDAAGIVTCERGRLHLRKDNGLARDVFTNKQMLKLRGNMGIAHVRYPTAGCSSSAEAQPFYVNSPFGLTLAHNGNLTNTAELKRALFVEDQRHINTDSDSEVLLNIFAHELQILHKVELTVADVFEAVAGVHRRCRGAYAVVIMIAGFGILGFRDPNGIRPVVFGKRKSEHGTEFMIASESVALDVLGFELIRDITPGEAVFMRCV
jgi:amidophosphoribosyltransferase